MSNLEPLRAIVADLEHAVESVAEKVAGAAGSDVAQTDVDELVTRVSAQVDRLNGLQAPATPTTAAPTAPGGVVAVDAPPAAGTSDTPPAAAASAPAWTPERPAG